MKKEIKTEITKWKVCGECKKRKHHNKFYKASRRRDGLYRICKECVAVRDEEKYKKNKELHKKRWRKHISDEKEKARIALRDAVKRGLVKKLPCFLCGEKKADGHHLIYSFKTKVVWLCRQHHLNAHYFGTIM